MGFVNSALRVDTGQHNEGERERRREPSHTAGLLAFERLFCSKTSSFQQVGPQHALSGCGTVTYTAVVGWVSVLCFNTRVWQNKKATSSEHPLEGCSVPGGWDRPRLTCTLPKQALGRRLRRKERTSPGHLRCPHGPRASLLPRPAGPVLVSGGHHLSTQRSHRSSKASLDLSCLTPTPGLCNPLQPPGHHPVRAPSALGPAGAPRWLILPPLPSPSNQAPCSYPE